MERHGRNRIWVVLGTLIAALPGLSGSGAAGAPVTPRLLVPAYFDPPGHSWTVALTAPAQTLLIVNPDNGPGTAVDPAYT